MDVIGATVKETKKLRLREMNAKTPYPTLGKNVLMIVNVARAIIAKMETVWRSKNLKKKKKYKFGFAIKIF